MKLLLTLLLSFIVVCSPLFAQEAEKPAEVKKEPTVAELQERLNNLIKTSVQKDAEIEKLKTQVATSPENVEKAVATFTDGLKNAKEFPSVKACKSVKGKALITLDQKTGRPVYAGCLL